MLDIHKLHAGYGSIPVLHGIDLHISPGEAVGILGHNGMGKTTLLRTIIGALLPTQGSIQFNGQDVSRLQPNQRARVGMAYVPQGREIFSLLTVEENLKTGLRAASKMGIKKVPDHIFDVFPVLKQMLKRRGGDLSGGQQQQLAIARALVLNPRLLILDEPTEGIQPNIVSEIGEVIIRLNRQRGKPIVMPKKNPYDLGEVHEAITKINHELGVTVLLVEQKLPFARKVADRFCIMDRGRHVAIGAMDTLSDDMVKRYLTV